MICRRHRSLALALALLAVPLSGADKMFVHLPGEPLASSTRLANAVVALGAHISERVPGLSLEVEIFRRWDDAKAAFDEDPEAVTILLSELSSLHDLADPGLVASHRFLRDGRGYAHFLVVVASQGGELQSLDDLAGGSLSLASTTSSAGRAWFERAVFEGRAVFDALDSVHTTADELEAVTSVLYSEIDAALVRETNTIVAAELGTRLRTIYVSPAISLPVLAVRTDRLPLATLAEALGDLDTAPIRDVFLGALSLDGLERPSTGDLTALLTAAGDAAFDFEIAYPGLGELPPDLPPVSPDDLSLPLPLELPSDEVAPPSP